MVNFLRLYKVTPKSSNSPQELHLIRQYVLFDASDFLKSSSLTAIYTLREKKKKSASVTSDE
jgi:hypothetical protein